MSYIGKSVKRVEDKRFITGKGTYTDDIKLANMAAGCFVRSPYAHAKILSIDTSEAEKMPGVVKIVQEPDFVGVVAKSMTEAHNAKQAIKCTHSPFQKAKVISNP